MLKIDDLTMDLKSRSVVREGTTIELTPTEFELLRFLIQHQDEVMTREQIISEVWGYDFVGDTNVVDVYIRYLRQKWINHFPQAYTNDPRNRLFDQI